MASLSFFLSLPHGVSFLCCLLPLEHFSPRRRIEIDLPSGVPYSLSSCLQSLQKRTEVLPPRSFLYYELTVFAYSFPCPIQHCFLLPLYLFEYQWFAFPMSGYICISPGALTSSPRFLSLLEWGTLSTFSEFFLTVLCLCSRKS